MCELPFLFREIGFFVLPANKGRDGEKKKGSNKEKPSFDDPILSEGRGGERMSVSPDRRDLVYQTAKWSTLSQAVLGSVSLVGFVDRSDPFLVALLVTDTIVQGVELCFYLLFLFYFSSFRSRIYYRYADWCVTTPLMLVSTIAFLDYLSSRSEGRTITLTSFWEERMWQIVGVVLLNASMLAVGFAHEIGRLPTVYLLLGWPPFIAVFAWIASVNATTAGGISLLLFLYLVWSLYGFAAFLPPDPKTISYNCLDVVSKNLYGLVVGVYMLASSSSTD